jgi:hypothetical protein
MGARMHSNAYVHPRLTAQLAILLVATLALSAVAVPAASAAPTLSCDPNGPMLAGPAVIYSVEGQAISDHIYTTDCEPTSWSVGGDLPAGVTFDSTARKFVGTPTTMGGWFQLEVTDTRGTAILEGSFRPLMTEVTLTGPGGADLDLADLSPGQLLELHGHEMPDGIAREVFWDETSLVRASAGGVFRFELAVPDTALRGPHQFRVVYELPGGQRYVTTHAVKVTDLELSGPGAIYPVVGVDSSYRYPGIDASADAEYRLEGELPAGMTFDGETGTVSGAPRAATEHPRVVTISVQDGDRSDHREVTITVTAAAPITLAPVMSPRSLGLNLEEIVLAVHSGGIDAMEEQLTRQLEQGRDANERIILPVGTHPETGQSTIVIGTELATTKETVTRLTEEAARTAAESATKELQALAEEQKLREQAERLKVLQEQQANTKAKLLLELERQKSLKAAAAAQAAAVVAAANRVKLEKAIQLLEEHKRQLKARVETKPVPEGSEVVLELHSDPVLLGQATVGASGEFLIRASVPIGTPLGNHQLVVTYTYPDGVVHTQSFEVSVVGAATAAVPAALDSAELPATGADLGLIGYAAAILTLLGAALLVRGRRVGVRTRIR